MRYSRKVLYKTKSKKILRKSTCLAVLISVFLSIGTPLDYKGNISYGLTGDDESQYTQYIVKRGDTLSDIAKEMGVDVSTLISDNSIRNKNHIYTGQKLKVRNDKPVNDDTDKNEKKPIESTTSSDSLNSSVSSIDNDDSYTYEYMGPDLISLNMRNTDIRDVISAIASYMDTYAILLEEPVRVNFQIKGVDPHKALELLLQSLGLSYIQDNNLLIVGKSDKLQKEFFNQMMLTRFDLKHITSDNIEPLVKKLGIPIQSITMDKNPKTIWIQGTPQSLAKVKELIFALDKKENAGSSLLLTEIKLNHITSDQIVGALNAINVGSDIITLDSNPKSIWIKASSDGLSEVRQVVSALDKRENAEASSESELTSVKLKNITTEKLAPVIKELDMPVQVITIPGILNTLWLQGTQQAVRSAVSMISSLDVAESSSNQYTMFLFKLNNVSAIDAVERLGLFEFQGVKTVAFSYPELGQDLLILCPVEIKTKVTTALEGIDFKGLGDSPRHIMLPVDSATGPYAYDVLDTRRSLLIKLMGELSDDRDIIDVSDNLWTEGGEEYRVLLVKSTPEIINKVKEMIKLIDSP